MRTTSAYYSRVLEADIRAREGATSKLPSPTRESPPIPGQLVAMLAGEAATMEEVHPLVQPMCGWSPEPCA